MALSMRNVCLQKNLNYLFRKNYPVLLIPLQNPSRELRGSRLGRGAGLDKTEAKFRELLKNLKQYPKHSVLNNNDVPETVLKPISIKDQTDIAVKLSIISEDDPSKRLEGKITPLKKLTYVRQLERKYHKCLTMLRMFGEKLQFIKVPITMGSDKLPCPVELMMPSPVSEAYRNQDEFSVGVGIDRNPKTVGFYLENLSEDSEYICIEPENLVILKNSHKYFIKDVQRYMRTSSLEAFSKSNKSGHWKSVSVRSSEEGDVMGIITLDPQDLSEDRLEEEKKNIRGFFETSQQSYNLKSLYIQTSRQGFELLLGDPHIVEKLNGIELQLSPSCFFLSNTAAASNMYGAIRKLCRVGSSTTVLDLFCGAGPLSMLFAPHVRKCVGVDACAASINVAEKNAVANNIHNVEFLHGNVENIMLDILSKDFHKDIISVINPAKTELSKSAVRVLRECKFLKKIVYISTKPKIAIDNFVRLCRPCGNDRALGKPFVPLLAIPVDLHPQTDHYALIVMFQRL